MRRLAVALSCGLLVGCHVAIRVAIAVHIEVNTMPSRTPIVQLKQLTTPIVAGQPMNLRVTSVDLDGDLVLGSLDFGDGTPPVEWQHNLSVQLTHVYAQPGAYTLSATVTDATARTASASQPILVDAGDVVVPPDPPEPLPGGLIDQRNLKYLGAFRLPKLDYTIYGTDLSAGLRAMGFNPSRHSLFVSMNEGAPAYTSYLCEISIVEPALADCVRVGRDCSGSELPEAALLQPPTEAFNGLLAACAQGSQSGCIPRGVLACADGELLLAGSINYDAGYQGIKSLYKRTIDLSNYACVGPLEIAAFGQGSAWNGGCCGGFHVPIPSAFQDALGGDVLCGNWDLSINSRVSWGPPSIVYRRADVDRIHPIPATPLCYYSSSNPTLGQPMQDGALWNDTGLAAGIVFVDGCRSILFFQQHSNDVCYGQGTNDPTLHEQPVPGVPGEIYCLDYEVGGKGQHGNPWTQRVMAYDANDLLAVKAGTKHPWDVVPYTHWNFDFPQFQGAHYLRGVTYDPAQQRIYIASAGGDNGNTNYYDAPVIHVYEVQLAPLRG